MPAPQAQQFKELAKTQFCSFAIKLPKDWRQPQGNPAAQQYGKAFKPSELFVPPKPTPPQLFIAASTNKYHNDTAGQISDKFTKYIDGISAAICSGWSNWQSTATLVGVMVNGPTASAGQVVGPPLQGLIMAANPPMATPQEIKFTNAIVQAISNGWQAYTATIKVPGMPWYPAFAAVPSPVAPPAPNVPCPVIALTQVTTPVSKSALKAQMIGNLGDPTALHHVELFDSIADAFEKCHIQWQASTMVNNVMGTGPVPTFAPPYVPVGPVVGGTANMTPGGFT